MYTSTQSYIRNMNNYKRKKKQKVYIKKSHTCEKGGACLRTSFWHLWMNLKNKYLFKKLLKQANKWNNFYIYNMGISLFYTCTKNLDDIIYSSWDIEHERLKLLFLDHFLPFYPLKTQKIQILKKLENSWRYHHFTHVPKIIIIWCMVP